jgi:tRNA threonylcarbamoyladenosine biosynthesis protein TsaE
MSHSADVRPPVERFLPAEADTLALGQRIARCLRPGMVLYLAGDLGAGKTTLARGILRGLGFQGRVKSPTFSLVEVYEISSLYLYHFDFYRFTNIEEWRDAGLREYFNPATVCLVEWPEKAAGLPGADLDIALRMEDGGRRATLRAATEAGTSCLEAVEH